MARNQAVNKTQAVRDFLKAHPGAVPSEIASALNKQGIIITSAYVAAVKTKIYKTAPPPVVEKLLDTLTLDQLKMIAQAIQKIRPRKIEVNKTQAVCDYLKANTKAKNAKVVEALAKQGITITANYVGNIKARHNTR